MEPSVIISILALALSGIMVVLTVKRDNKSNTSSDISKEIRIAESFKEINVKLDYQSRQLSEVADGNRNNGKEMQQLNNKLVNLESKLNTAFEKIDENRNRIKDIENRKE